MLNKYLPKNFSHKLEPLQSKLKGAFGPLWPINWSYFKEPQSLLLAVLSAPSYLKFALGVCVFGLLASIYFLSFGTYLVFTKEVPGQGGEVREAVLAGNLSQFNPVLEPNNEAERKVTGLLFHPLYEVNFPDFLSIPNGEIKIRPILLEKAPQWQDLSNPNLGERYRSLRFTLKKDIKWSNQKPITMEDIQYTFERLKEEKASSQLRDIFANIEITKISDREFDLTGTVSNPQLIYLANFSPISKEYFENQKIEALINNTKSITPEVTSGYFNMPSTVSDPESLATNKSADKPNPIRAKDSNRIQSVVLVKNPVQNTNEKIYLDRFIVKNYDNLADVGGEKISIERDALAGKLDLYSRPLTANLNISSATVKQKTNLTQKLLPTNAYYSFYLNSRVTENNFYGYLINQYLRKYIICSLMNLQPEESFRGFLEEIPKNKKVMPIQLGETATPDCPSSQAELEEMLKSAKTATGGQIYSFTVDPQTKLKKVQSFNGDFQLTFITLLETKNPILDKITQFFESIGLQILIINDSSTVNQYLNAKEKPYHIAFLPVTLVGKDLYPLFGQNGKDLLQVNRNNRDPVPQYDFEENIKKYSQSNTADSQAKQKLTEFFGKEYVLFNWFRGRQEINYSERATDMNFNYLQTYNSIQDLYTKLPTWYVQTKRE